MELGGGDQPKKAANVRHRLGKPQESLCLRSWDEKKQQILERRRLVWLENARPSGQGGAVRGGVGTFSLLKALWIFITLSTGCTK